jgi:peptidoglycan/xylan/chitin deacetylase (PgdA/CDA1 family)
VIRLFLLAACLFHAALSAGFNRPLVTLTFDDGYLSAYERVLPLLQRFGIPATFYIDTGALGNHNRLNIKQLREIQKAGFEIGSHTVTHPHLRELYSKKVIRELAGSKKTLEGVLKGPIAHFAPPYGETNSRVLRLIKRYYDSSRSVSPGYNSKKRFNRFAIKVKNIRATTSLSQIAHYLDQTLKDKTWLVLVYHDIAISSSPLSIPPSQFRQHLAAIKKRPLTVATIGDALAELLPQID